MKRDEMIEKAKEIMATDDRIEIIRFYNGFVANSYKWPCLREFLEVYRSGKVIPGRYDAKRSYGKGPRWVAFSKKRGRLQSA